MSTSLVQVTMAIMVTRTNDLQHTETLLEIGYPVVQGRISLLTHS